MLKLSSRIKLVAALAIGVCSLTMLASAGDVKKGKGKQGTQGTQVVPRTTAPTLTPASTPPGNHYGWQKGRGNPHRTVTASPTPGTTDVSPTPTPSATASPTASPTATPTPTP